MLNENTRLQDYLSLGYLYLIFLGVARESLYYGWMGVNILNYASILDVVLSPLAYIVDHYGLAIAICVFLYIVLSLENWQKKYSGRKWFGKMLKSTEEDSSPSPEVLRRFLIFMFGIGLASYFFGVGMGSGAQMYDRLSEGDFKYQDQLYYTDGTSQEVEILGKNGTYVFYAAPADSVLLVAPISGNLRYIREK